MPLEWMNAIQNGLPKYSANLSTDAAGSRVVNLPETGLIVSVTPRTTGEYTNSVNVTGAVATITFKKFKGALGLTLGTLLTATVFEDSPGVVNFDITATRPTQ